MRLFAFCILVSEFSLRQRLEHIEEHGAGGKRRRRRRRMGGGGGGRPRRGWEGGGLGVFVFQRWGWRSRHCCSNICKIR
jgi:hypothetical protein